jgi:hypothetical protein
MSARLSEFTVDQKLTSFESNDRIYLARSTVSHYALWSAVLTATTAAAVAALGPFSGSDYGLAFDGSDEAVAFTAVINAASPGDIIRPYSPTGANLVIGSRVQAEVDDITVDLSLIGIDFKKYGEIAAQGDFEELPASNLFRIRSNVTPGTSIIPVDTTPQGSDMSLLAIGARVIIRGENDANQQAIQRHEATIIARDTTLGAETITISPPTPSDEGTFLVTYPDSESPVAVDRTLISVKVGQFVDSDIEVGQDYAPVPDPSQYPVGSLVQLTDNLLSSSIGGTSTNSIREEMLEVRDFDGDNVFFTCGVERDYAVSRGASLFKIDSVKGVKIIGARENRATEAPDASPASRKHYYMLAYTQDCSVTGVFVNEQTSPSYKRGQAVRCYRSMRHRVSYCNRIGPEDAVNLAVSGDIYGFADYNSSDGRWEHTYTSRCRHGHLAQLATRPTFSHFHSVNDMVNGCDTHGLNSVGVTFEHGRIEVGRELAADVTTKSAIVLGNSTHRAGDKRTRIINVDVVGSPDIADTRGITIRAGVVGVYTESFNVKGVERGAEIQRNSNQPSLEIRDIDLSGMTVDGATELAANLTGQAPAWATATEYTGSSSNPAYVENDGKVYRTEIGGTSGVTGPTHGAGTVSDGGVDWIFVTASPYYPLVNINLGIRARNCAGQILARRVAGLQVNRARIEQPATPVGGNALGVTEITDLEVRFSEFLGAAGGIGALTCPNARIEHNLFSVDDEEAWYDDNGGNDGTELNWNSTRGTTGGIDLSGGSAVTVRGS